MIELPCVHKTSHLIKSRFIKLDCLYFWLKNTILTFWVCMNVYEWIFSTYLDEQMGPESVWLVLCLVFCHWTLIFCIKTNLSFLYLFNLYLSRKKSLEINNLSFKDVHSCTCGALVIVLYVFHKFTGKINNQLGGGRSPSTSLLIRPVMKLLTFHIETKKRKKTLLIWKSTN